jgi:hypothetical protein
VRGFAVVKAVLFGLEESALPPNDIDKPSKPPFDKGGFAWSRKRDSLREESSQLFLYSLQLKTKKLSKN